MCTLCLLCGGFSLHIPFEVLEFRARSNLRRRKRTQFGSVCAKKMALPWSRNTRFLAATARPQPPKHRRRCPTLLLFIVLISLTSFEHNLTIDFCNIYISSCCPTQYSGDHNQTLHDLCVADGHWKLTESAPEFIVSPMNPIGMRMG